MAFVIERNGFFLASDTVDGNSSDWTTDPDQAFRTWRVVYATAVASLAATIHGTAVQVVRYESGRINYGPRVVIAVIGKDGLEHGSRK